MKQHIAEHKDSEQEQATNNINFPLPPWLKTMDPDSILLAAFVFAAPIVSLIWLKGRWTDLHVLTQIYIVGVVSYWLRWLGAVIANALRLCSVFDANMAQMGLRRNIFLGTLQEKQSISHIDSLTMAGLCVLIQSLLSWAAYLIDIYAFVKQRIYRWRRPKAMKEIEWILKHHLLSPLDVVRFDVKLAEILLDRKLTREECDSRQEQLDANGVNVKMTEVIALNNRGRLSGDPGYPANKRPINSIAL